MSCILSSYTYMHRIQILYVWFAITVLVLHCFICMRKCVARIKQLQIRMRIRRTWRMPLRERVIVLMMTRNRRHLLRVGLTARPFSSAEKVANFAIWSSSSLTLAKSFASYIFYVGINHRRLIYLVQAKAPNFLSV